MTLPSACPTLCSFTKFVVDKRGHVRGRFGPKTPAASLATLLKELLEDLLRRTEYVSNGEQAVIHFLDGHKEWHNKGRQR